MTQSLNNTTLKTESAIPTEQTTDEFGYVDKTVQTAVVEPTPIAPVTGYGKPAEVTTPPVEGDKVVAPVTGYGKPAEVTTPPIAVVPPVNTPEEVYKTSISESLKNLPSEYDKEVFSKFAVDNKFTKEQAEAYVKFAQIEKDQIKKDQEAQVLEQRKKWSEELKSDPTFGNENFDGNVHKVEKMLDKHMPNLKKALTERGSMMPPYIMKDLLSLSKLLNPTTDLIKGDASIPKSEDSENFLESMYG